VFFVKEAILAKYQGCSYGQKFETIILKAVCENDIMINGKNYNKSNIFICR
jgi:hypothetical protein